MRKLTVLLLALVTSSAIAQQAPAPQQTIQPSFQSNLTETAQAPSYADLYCSGFVTNEAINAGNKVIGGLPSPNATLFAVGNFIYLSGGGVQEGARFSIIRELRDPNRSEPFKGQRAELASMGQAYADVGRVRVVALRGTNAVAEVEYSCQNITLGDIAVPFQEHAPVAYRKSIATERFPASPGRVSARIVMAQEFDTMLGTGRKVYINAGSNKGVKVGDYFHATRGYERSMLSEGDILSMHAPVGDDTQKHPGNNDRILSDHLPTRTLGHLIVLTVTPTSSTAMITDSLEGIQVGDGVELEGGE